MSLKTKALTKVAALICGLAGLTTVAAAAPSAHLGNNQRTAFTNTPAPAGAVLQWTYSERHPPRHAWKEPNREAQYIDFDYATQTTIAGNKVFFGSSADHKVYALSLKTGNELWSFATEGPVRFAPAAGGDGRIYAASDDGFLYCLEARSGELLWKFRGGPNHRKSIGNEQMISHWPARTGAMIEGDKLYFTAGMWSRDGVFLYCLNREDGSVIWKNDTSGYHFATLPHSTGFAGVAPQGYLALHRGRLYVPTGRGAPACFDAKTGEFLFYENGHGYKPHQPGGSRIMAWQDWVIMKRRSQHVEESVRYEERESAKGAASGLYALDWRTGKPAWSLTDKNIVAATGDTLILGGQGPVIRVNIHDILEGYEKYWKDGKFVGWDSNIPDAEVAFTRSGPGKLIPNPAWMSPLPFRKWSADVGRVYVLMRAGDTVLAGGREVVSAIDASDGRVLWQKQIEGDARGISVGRDHILVSSTAGKLYCFAAGETDSDREILHQAAKPAIDEAIVNRAKSILETCAIRSGYALMLGVGDGQLLHELIRQSELIIYCLEPDRAKVEEARKMLDDAGLQGVRAAVHHGAPDDLPYSPYCANLLLWGEELGSGTDQVKAAELYRVLRPFGGIALELSAGKSAPARQFLTAGGVPEAEIAESAAGLRIIRGELPGAGEWTHAHADIGRTGCSEDSLVSLPLGMLWWGGPGPARIVSRHWRAPSPLFSHGNLYIQGQHDIIAVDAYNGRELWNRHLQNVGRFPPTHRGGNIAADSDGVYCVLGLKCLRLDAKTGETAKEYVFALGDEHDDAMASVLPELAKNVEGRRLVWEYLGLSRDRIIGTLGAEADIPDGELFRHLDGYQPSSHIFVFDKPSGNLLWQHRLERSVIPTAIVADDSAIYLLDRSPDVAAGKAKRRGEPEKIVSSLKALNLDTGEVLWTRDNVFSPWKALMLSEGRLVAYPNPAETTAHDGDKGVGVFAADNGEPLWSEQDLTGVAETGRGGTMRHTFIVGDTVFLPWAYDLNTGKQKLLESDPLTGEAKVFDVSGKNFCGTFSAAEDLLVYRSASIGFAEITRDSGSHWLPEARPSCWISAIPAGGMVLAPEGYSTCICPYNYKTSMALIPVERHENWSVYLKGGRRDKKAPKAKRTKNNRKGPLQAIAPVKHLRVNFNAPGDQMDDSGNLWLAWPRPVQPKKTYIIQSLPVEQSASCDSFRFNADSLEISGTADPWLYTSGLAGPASLQLTLSDRQTGTYTARFHFAETLDAAPGERVFDVKIGGETVLSKVDIAQQAGGKRHALRKQVTGIQANGTMKIELTPVGDKPPILCSLEVVRE